MTLRWARTPSWGLWWQLCVRQQWKVSTPPPGGETRLIFLNGAADCNIYSVPNVRSLCLSLHRTDDNTNCRVDTAIIQRRLPVLLKYLNSDTERQLQALYALQMLIVALDQPPSKCCVSASSGGGGRRKLRFIFLQFSFFCRFSSYNIQIHIINKMYSLYFLSCVKPYQLFPELKCYYTFLNEI